MNPKTTTYWISNKIVYVILLLTSSLYGISQNRTLVDSLLVKLDHAVNDSDKAEICKELCWEYRKTNLKLADDYGLNALSIYRLQKNILGQCDVLNKLGIIKRNTGEYSLALDYFFKILRIAESPLCNKEIAYSNNNICDIYIRLEKYDDALEFAEKAYQIFQLVNDSLGIAYNLNLKGLIYENEKEWNNALHSFKQSLDIRIKIGHQTDIATSLQNIGDCYIELNLIDSAFVCYKNSLAIFDKAGYKSGFIYISLGKYYSAKKDYKSAIYYLNQAIESVKEIKNPFVFQKACEVLHRVYFEMKDYKSAYQIQTLAINTKDSLQRSDYVKKIIQLEMNYNFEQQNAQTQLDEIKKDELFKTRIYEQKQITYSLIIILLGIVVVALFILINYRYVRKTNRLLKENNDEILKQKTTIHTKNKELQELNATKDKFFSIIAHDLKNPFNGILGFSDLLVNSPHEYNQEETMYFLKMMRGSAQSAYKLLENLLDWAMSQTGRIEFKPEIISLENLIIDIINITASNSLPKKIKVSYEITDNIDIFADRNMINTILRNLVNNAIKYTHKTGTVKIVATNDENYVLISVIDNGVGIKPEEIEKLFNLSDKTSTPGTENEKGTGLGLLLCKEFVEKHGGKIWVESEFGKGSNFRFSIPLYNK